MANNALSLGGDTSYIACGTADPSSGAFTVGGWMNWGGSPNTADSSQAFITKHTTFSSNMRWWFGLDKTNSYKFLVYGDGGSFPFWNFAPTSGVTTHAVWVHDTSAGNEKLYINGAFHSSITAITLGAQTGADLQIGASSAGTAERFKGTVDGMFINTAILTAGEIQSIYLGLNPAVVTGAYATWHMDEGTGTSTADSTGSNTGTLSGATLPTWVSGIETVGTRTGLTLLNVG